MLQGLFTDTGKMDKYPSTSQLPSNLWYKMRQIPKLKCFSFRLTVVFAQSIEPRMKMYM